LFKSRLCHQDFHSENVVLRYNRGELEARAIDFEVSNFDSCVDEDFFTLAESLFYAEKNANYARTPLASLPWFYEKFVKNINDL